MELKGPKGDKIKKKTYLVKVVTLSREEGHPLHLVVKFPHALRQNTEGYPENEPRLMVA